MADGNVFVRNLGGHDESTRDVLFVVALLQLQKAYPNDFPANVDFVLNPGNLPRVSRRQAYEGAYGYSNTGGISGPLPFALSFAVSPQFLDVGIPDPVSQVVGSSWKVNPIPLSSRLSLT